MRYFLLATLALMLSACAQPQLQASGSQQQSPRLHDDHVEADDGHVLPLYRWLPEEGKPVKAVAVGLHGFGDYGASFEVLSEVFKEHGIALYAYDQRGFGSTEKPGIWAGRERLASDVGVVISLLRETHPDTPVYLVGKSMGGAVAMLAVTGESPPEVDGVAYIAPAVWGRKTMPWYQRAGLWIMLRIRPGMTFSGDAVRDLGIRATDDPEVARALSRDPLVQKEARIDTLHGLTTLMSDALEASPDLTGPALILYGDNDQVIPPEPVCAMLERLPDPDAVPWRMTLYPDGYHMLTRYTGAADTHADLVAWLLDPSASLPSGQEVDRFAVWERICSGEAPWDA